MKNIHKDAVEVIFKIQGLLGELTKVLGAESAPKAKIKASSLKTERYTGAAGGIKLLLKERVFAKPKTVGEVITRLRQEGFNYSATVISMALLRAVRSRSLVRLPSDGAGKEKWVYAERK